MSNNNCFFMTLKLNKGADYVFKLTAYKYPDDEPCKYIFIYLYFCYYKNIKRED